MRRLAIGAALALAAGVGAVPAEAAKTPVLKVFQFEPTNSSSYASVPEGQSALVYVERSYLKGPASVDVVVTGGSAEADDVAFTTGTATLKNGTQFAWVVIPLAADDAIEGDETVVVSLANPSKGYVADDEWTFTIEDATPPAS